MFYCRYVRFDSISGATLFYCYYARFEAISGAASDLVDDERCFTVVICKVLDSLSAAASETSFSAGSSSP